LNILANTVPNPPETPRATMVSGLSLLVAVLLLSVTATNFKQASAVRVVGDASDHSNHGEKDAADSDSAWNIFDKTGPKLSNVSQGNLGDCYLMAGLAAIVKTHPKLIEGVFVGPGTLSQYKALSIYQLRFLVDGKEDIVAIDDIIPMQRHFGGFAGFTPHFAGFNDGKNAWPLLIEKGFAKIAGSYLAISSGMLSESFKALTQAPVDQYQKVTGTLWMESPISQFINEALQNNWPIAAGTAPNWNEKIGTADGHAYAVLGLAVKENQQAVQIYNPWAKNQYTGALKHLSRDSQGDYWMLLSEFVAVFNNIARARVFPNGHLASQSVPVGPAYLTFSVSTDKPFYVQLQWPSYRSLPRECDYDYNSVNLGLMVTPASDQGAGVAAPFKDVSKGNLRVSMPGKAGEYHVLAVSFFEGMTAISEVVVNVYSEEKVNNLKYHPEVSASSGANLVFGTCDQMKYDGHRFTASASSFRGSPLWKSSKGEIMWYSASQGLAVSPSEAQFQYAHEDLSSLRCYESNVARFSHWLKGHHSGLAELSEASSNLNSNSNSAGAEEKKVQVCDQEKVKAKLQRNQNLNNYNELMLGREDSLFLPRPASIGEAGVDCGDSATGKRTDCGDLDEWGSLTRELGKPDYVPR